MASILVVDDVHSALKALDAILTREGFTVHTVASGAEALTYLEQQDVDVILCDIRMPKVDGLTVLRQVKIYDASIAVIMMSGHNDVAAAVEAMKEGAVDYLMKPLSKDHVLSTVQKALAVRALVVENLLLKRQIRDQFARAQAIGSSPTWRRVCQMVEQVAPSQATVLLSGESGTGKEVIASMLHRLSARANNAFIILNAAAMPGSLLEAELFGYEKGAFTGALNRKPGHFEMADGGTLFLDEIGDMPLEIQAKLLRVLQDGSFKRLGGTRALQAAVRIVAATNKDLVKEVAEGRFRQDLYYRLNVITLHLPPLRERRQDIPLLAVHFLGKYAQENRKTVTVIQHEALQCLQAYAWPGNVRELENVMERAVVLAQGSAITVDDLHLEEPRPASPLPSSEHYFVLPADAAMSQIEREAIIQALRRSEGNRQATARQLQIAPATLYRKFKEYNIE